MLRIIMLFMLAALMLTGCGTGTADNSRQEQIPDNVSAVTAGKKVLMKFADGQGVLLLNDSQAAKNLYAMLPLQLSFKDFNHTEKISYPPRSIHEGLHPEGHQPVSGDLCIYAPWGNLCIFYRDYKMSGDLFYLGHLDAAGIRLLTDKQEDFTVELIKAEQ